MRRSPAPSARPRIRFFTLRLCRLLALALLGLAPAARAADEAGWTQRSTSGGVTIYTREAPGSRVHEVRAVGEVDAPPRACFQVVTDFDHYVDIMPYTRESRVVGHEGDKVWLFYTVVAAPLVSLRDYTLRVVDDSMPDAAGGGYRTRWTIANDKGPPLPKGVVRIGVNTGHWDFAALDGGKRTRVTYQVLIDPSGSVPTWIADRANLSALPNVFRAIRKAVTEARYQR